MDLQLRGDTAVVIGGAKGIGRAIAAAFAREGASVAILDVDPAVEDAAAAIAAESGVAATGHVGDATDFPALEALSAFIGESLGPPRHLVYAAGRGSGKYGFPFWNLAPDDWPDVLRVNLLGAVNAAHAFAPGMIEARRGTMLFLSSIAGQIGSQTDPPYSAAKAALINFAQCAAKDLAEYDVRVNTICPGMIKTELNRSVWDAWRRGQIGADAPDYDSWAEAKIRRVAPLGRWQTPEDVAALAVFLASPLAKNITGQTMNVDGGQVMH
ncbi:MAG: SDR family oxidoreductase [Planctomycetes bacterium]|nr:SDR family oxidoreductase [Planctomycetota bacterium]